MLYRFFENNLFQRDISDIERSVLRVAAVCGDRDGMEGARIAWSAAFDRDNEGKLDFSFHGDANRDGRIDKIDKHLVQRLAAMYLEFDWS